MSAKKRATATVLLAFAAAILLTGCHVAGHLPPGQLKKVADPPPGHGGLPPGQTKRP